MSGEVRHIWGDVAGTVRVLRSDGGRTLVHLFDLVPSSAFDAQNASSHRAMMAKLADVVCESLDRQARESAGER